MNNKKPATVPGSLPSAFLQQKFHFAVCRGRDSLSWPREMSISRAVVLPPGSLNACLGVSGVEKT